jgi:endonuclease/exonuclease/phosphatase (EEP) superfamily protein YafD
VRIFTFNTANDFIAPHDLTSLLRISRADIVGLEELSERNAGTVRALPDDILPHRLIHGEYIRGKAVLSNFPLMEAEEFELYSGRLYIRAVLDLWGQPCTVFVAHLPPGDYRRAQPIHPAAPIDIAMLLERVDISTPTLLLGDFNVIARSAIYARIRDAGFIDTFAASGRGPGFTYPRRHMKARIPLLPLIRIDYIWATPHFEPIHSMVWPGLGSDHQPVLSELRLRDQMR